jgi:hypothetical protein
VTKSATFTDRAVAQVLNDETSDGPRPPIASYVLGQNVNFLAYLRGVQLYRVHHGDLWRPGIVTRLGSGLCPNGSVWHEISVSSTYGLPDGEWERAGVYTFGERDRDRVSPASTSASRRT